MRSQFLGKGRERIPYTVSKSISSASEMTYIVSGGTLNSTRSLKSISFTVYEILPSASDSEAYVAALKPFVTRWR